MNRQFKTKEEIEEYFSGDRIQCLICNKWYKEIGWHLKAKHELSCDEYKEMFGLPWSRGLVSEDLHNKKSDIAKELSACGRIGQHFNVEDFREKRNKVLRKPVQPFQSDFAKKLGTWALSKYRNPCPPGRERIWFDADFERYLDELKNTGKTIMEVYKQGQLPHPNMLYRYAKQNLDFGERLKMVSNYRGIRKSKPNAVQNVIK